MKGGITTGAGIAVPAVGKLANDIISYKGMQRKGDTVLGFDGAINVHERNYTVIDVIPDFTGASKKHLLPSRLCGIWRRRLAYREGKA